MHYEGDGGGPTMAAGTVEAMVASGVDGGGDAVVVGEGGPRKHRSGAGGGDGGDRSGEYGDGVANVALTLVNIIEHGP